ncbi:MAG: hypothetical protein ACSHX4_08945 [Opitutaceae bacterium]
MNRIIASILLLILPLALGAMDLPKKEGFTWWEIEPLKGAFLVPDGWHKKSVSRPDTMGFFITKEKIVGDRGSFETGLSLNVFKSFRAKKGIEPVRFIYDFKAGYSKKGKVLEEWTRDMGPFKSYGFRSEGIVAGVSTTIHHLFIINPNTGTLYYFFFEAPTAEFNQAWIYGEQMMEMLLIDDEI